MRTKCHFRTTLVSNLPWTKYRNDVIQLECFSQYWKNVTNCYTVTTTPPLRDQVWKERWNLDDLNMNPFYQIIVIFVWVTNSFTFATIHNYRSMYRLIIYMSYFLIIYDLDWLTHFTKCLRDRSMKMWWGYQIQGVVQGFFSLVV